MKTVQKLMVMLALTGICMAQPAASDGQPVTRTSGHHVAKKSPKKAKPAASTEDIKQFKELIQAQQAQIEAEQLQIDQLKQHFSQNDQQTQQAQQAASEAQKSAAAAQEKVTATDTLVADTNAKVDTVKSDVSDLKTTATSAAETMQEGQKRVGILEALTNRFRMSGDVRVRYENFFQHEAKVEDRHRFRFRLRFGLDGKLSDDFVGGFALASGSQVDPTSSNQTLGDITNSSTTCPSNVSPNNCAFNNSNSPDFMRKSINIDRAYITWNPQAFKWLSATGGKFAYPWVRTNPTFDPDINPEGFSEKIAVKLASPLVKEVSVTGMQLVLATNNSNSLTAPNTDSWIYGAQIGTKLQLGKFWSMVPTYALLNFVRPNTAIFGTNGGASANGAFVGTQFAPNNMDNCTTSVRYPRVTVGPGKGFCSQFLYSDLIVSNVIKTGLPRLPFNFIGEYEKNLNAKSDAPNALFNPRGDNKIHDTLYYVEASLGQNKNPGDIQFGYAYTHTEQDAVISSFVESDQFHQTNNEQHRVFFNWKVRNNTTLGYTQWVGRFLEPQLSLAPGTANPYLKRGQLDVVYAF